MLKYLYILQSLLIIQTLTNTKMTNANIHTNIDTNTIYTNPFLNPNSNNFVTIPQTLLLIHMLPLNLANNTEFSFFSH